MTYMLFGGGMYMVLIGFIFQMHPQRKAINLYFSAMYVSTGLIVLYAWAERTRLIYNAYLLYNMQIPLCYVFAPLLFFGFSQITDLDRKPAKILSPYFLPAAVSSVVILVTNIANADFFRNLPSGVTPLDIRRHPSFFYVHLLGLGSNLYILYYLSRIIINGIRFFSRGNLETAKELRLMLMFISMFYLDVILMMVAHAIQSIDLLHVAKFLSSSTFILFSFYSFRYPDYTQQIIGKTRNIRYKHTQLRGLDTESLLERLDYLMESEKIYRDMELSLAGLSEQLMVSPHQLSEILNERLKVGFSAYLNSYRIREAERLLITKPDTSIIEIAFEVGYNSKTSFNNNFLKETDMTPSDYRKKNAVKKKMPLDTWTMR